MPLWLSIVIAVIGLIGSVLGILGFTTYHNERMKHKAEKQNRREDEEEEAIEKAREEMYLRELRSVIQEEMAPIKADITVIKNNLALNTIGTVTLLRDRMKAILDECNDKGYATVGIKANWMELYKTYQSLGGNHFQEYVDAWKKEMEDLPTKKRAKKKLVENTK